MIEKMKFISVIGPKDQLDTVTRQYLCRYEIQLENAMGELKHLNNITPNAELNPYRQEEQQRSLRFMEAKQQQ